MLQGRPEHSPYYNSFAQAITTSLVTAWSPIQPFLILQDKSKVWMVIARVHHVIRQIGGFRGAVDPVPLFIPPEHQESQHLRENRCKEEETRTDGHAFHIKGAFLLGEES